MDADPCPLKVYLSSWVTSDIFMVIRGRYVLFLTLLFYSVLRLQDVYLGSRISNPASGFFPSREKGFMND
jgi:hypothetical protein